MALKRILVCLLMFGIVACSNKVQKIVPEKENIITKNGNSVTIFYAIEDKNIRPLAAPERLEKLRVITRGDTASKALTNGIIGGILCNPFSLFSCSWKDLGFSKENLVGKITDIDNISKSYAYPMYKELLKQKLEFIDSKDYRKIPIYFVPNENYLVYDDEFYKLVAGFNIYVDGFYSKDIFKCTKEKSGIPYEKWIAKNYQFAIEEGKKLIEQCFMEFDKEHFETIRNQLEIRKQNIL